MSEQVNEQVNEQVKPESIPAWVWPVAEIIVKAIKWWMKNGLRGKPSKVLERLEKAKPDDLVVMVNLSDSWGNIVKLGKAIKDVFVKKALEGLETQAGFLGTCDRGKEWVKAQGSDERLLGAILVDLEGFEDVVKEGTKQGTKTGPSIPVIK